MLSLDETINYFEKLAEEDEAKAIELSTKPAFPFMEIGRLKKNATQERQVAEWLQELKSLNAKHGKWEKFREYGGCDYSYYCCSLCGKKLGLDIGTPVDNGMLYCPNCGADMRGKQNE